MNFEKAKTTYRENAYIQENMAKKLVDLMIKITNNNSYDKVFEIGAGTGFLTDEIRKSIHFKELILNDLTDNFTGIIPDKYIKGDILEVEIPEKSDLILSNACFQWILDYKKLFSKLKKGLKKGGYLVFSCFGNKNFIQIKDITGIGLCYPDLDDFIKNEGFEILYFEESLETIYFKDVEEVLKHIKYTGVKTKNKIWTKSDLIEFKKQYKLKYKDDMGFEVTYHPLYYIIRAL